MTETSPSPHSRQREHTAVATPIGVWEEPALHSPNAEWRNIAPAATGGTEAQTLLTTSSGAWIGTRSGLAFVPR